MAHTRRIDKAHTDKHAICKPIRVSEETIQKLKSLKIYKHETYDDVISRVYDYIAQQQNGTIFIPVQQK